MKLYEIANEYVAFMEAVENGDIPEDAIEDTLEGITFAIETKVDNIACLLKNLDAEMVAIRTEEKRLAERRKAKENAYERLKDYLSKTLLNANLNKVETARNKISFRKSEVVEIADESAFLNWASTHRDDFLKYSLPTINKTLVKEALKADEEIVGATLVTKNNLQLR